MEKNWKEVELGDISTMKFGEIPKKGKNLLYTEPELQVVAKGIEDMGRVKLSRPKSPIINTSIVIKLNEDIADKRYCYYYLKTQNLKDISTDTKKPQITITNLKKFRVKIPPLAEQKRIAAILSTFDKKIKKSKEISKTLEKAAQAIFRRWFIDFEFPDEDDKPYKSNGGEFVNTDWGLLPKGWRVGKYTEITEVISAAASMAENQSGFTLKGKGNMDRYLVFMLTEICNKNLLKKSGGLFKIIDLDRLETSNILIPSKTVIDMFKNTSAPLFEEIRKINMTNNALLKLRGKLLLELTSGEMRVVV
jgi:restriction endonuclease S subunit